MGWCLFCAGIGLIFNKHPVVGMFLVLAGAFA